MVSAETTLGESRIVRRKKKFRTSMYDKCLVFCDSCDELTCLNPGEGSYIVIFQDQKCLYGPWNNAREACTRRASSVGHCGSSGITARKSNRQQSLVLSQLMDSSLGLHTPPWSAQAICMQLLWFLLGARERFRERQLRIFVAEEQISEAC